MLGRELDQALALGRRERAAGRVVEVGDHVGELHRPVGERRLERVRRRCRRPRAATGHQLDAGAAEQQQRAVVGGLLDDHPVAGLEHVAEEQRRRLHRAVGDHHPLRLDPVELGCDPLAEARVAAPGAVGERPLPVVVERLRGRRADGLGGQDVGAGGAAGEGDQVGGHGGRVYERTGGRRAVGRRVRWSEANKVDTQRRGRSLIAIRPRLVHGDARSGARGRPRCGVTTPTAGARPPAGRSRWGSCPRGRPSPRARPSSPGRCPRSRR